jgi:hypothetical protein
MKSTPGKKPAIDTARARIYFTDGHVEHFPNQILAFEVWLGLPKGIRAAFRSANDSRPVYPWDYVL